MSQADYALGEAIRRARLRHGLTQAELAAEEVAVRPRYRAGRPRGYTRPTRSWPFSRGYWAGSVEAIRGRA